MQVSVRSSGGYTNVSALTEGTPVCTVTADTSCGGGGEEPGRAGSGPKGLELGVGLYITRWVGVVIYDLKVVTAP